MLSKKSGFRQHRNARITAVIAVIDLIGLLVLPLLLPTQEDAQPMPPEVRLHQLGSSCAPTSWDVHTLHHLLAFST